MTVFSSEMLYYCQKCDCYIDDFMECEYEEDCEAGDETYEDDDDGMYHALRALCWPL